jgi:hypothetical protein
LLASTTDTGDAGSWIQLSDEVEQEEFRARNNAFRIEYVRMPQEVAFNKHAYEEAIAQLHHANAVAKAMRKAIHALEELIERQ